MKCHQAEAIRDFQSLLESSYDLMTHIDVMETGQDQYAISADGVRREDNAEDRHEEERYINCHPCLINLV